MNGGFSALPVWGGGGLYLEGLIHGGAYSRNFTVIGDIFTDYPPFLSKS